MFMRARVFVRAVVVLATVAASPFAFGATVTFNHGGDGFSWSDPLNWSTGLLPGSSDDVIISNTGGSQCLVNVNATVKSIVILPFETVQVQSGRVLTVNNLSTIDSFATLWLQDSSFSSTGALNVDGEILIEGGTLGGSGVLNITSVGSLSVSPSANASVISRTTTNAGTIVYYDPGVSGLNNWIFSGATLTNTGTIDIQSDYDIDPGLASPILNNNSGGVIKKSTGSGTTALNLTVNNAAGAMIQALSGTLALNSGGTLSGGTITGAGAVLIDGNFTWSGGTIAGSGPRILTITSTPTISCSAGNCTLNGATLQLLASTTFSASSNALVLSNGASLTIDTGQTINLTNDGDFSNGGGAASSIVNRGTIWKSGAGTSTIGVPVTLTGTSTVDIDTGTLQFGSGATVASGATLDIASFRTLEVTGGVFLFNSGSVSMPGSGDLTVSGGTLRVPTSITMTIPNLTLLGSGVIDGAGAVHVSGNFAWLGGTIAGGGPRVLNSTSVPLFFCSLGNCTLNGAALQLQASGTFSASSNALVFSNGASLTIDPGKTLSITNDGDFTDGGGAASSIINNGTIWKKTSFGTSTIGVPVTLTGTSTVDIDAGTLQFGGGATIATGATLDITPFQTLEVTGGLFLLSAGTVSAGGNFKVSGGTLRVPTGVTKTIPNLTLQGSGVIDGGGTLILSGTTFWSGGTMGSATAPGGITQVNSGNSLNITNAGVTTLTQNRVVLNNGSVGYGGVAPNNLTMSGNSSITNNGTFNVSDGTIGLSGSALIENFGTISKVAGTGTTAILPPVNNNSGGTVSVPAGTIALSGGGIAAGAWSISSGATLNLAGGTFSVASTATVTGPGPLLINGATLDAAAGVDLTCPLLGIFSGAITGAGAVRVSGNFLWSGGTIAGSGPRVLLNSSGATIDCALGNCLLDGAALQLQDSPTFSASSNSLVFSNGASLIIDPGKGLSITSDGDFVDGGGAPSSLINNGTIFKAAPNVTAFGVPVTLSGTATVFINDGTLQFAGGVNVAANATINITAGKTLEVTGGVFQFNSGPVTMTGGDFKVSAGTLRVATGTITIPNVTLQGGTIDGGGTLILSGTATWASGSMGSATAPGGITQVNSGSTLNITGAGSQFLTQGRELLNSDTITYGGSSTLTMSGGSKITNYGDFNLIADGNINLSGSATIDNHVVIEKTGGSGTSTLFPDVNSAGAVIASSGTLALAGDSTISLNVAPTAPATIAFTGGMHSILGAISGTGTIAFSGAIVTVSNSFTIGALSITAGNAILDANGSADAFTMTGGTLGGSGTLTLNNGGTWSGGTMSGSGTAINPATKTLTISAPVTLNSTLQNDGTLSVSDNVAGSGTIANNGTLNAAVNITVAAAVNNSGQVSTSSALTLTGGGTHSGTFNVTTPGNLSFSSGTHSMSGGGSIGGTGTLSFSGATATVSVPVNVGTLNVTGGTATLDANGSADAFTMTGGTLGGSGTLTLSNGGTWSGGTMSGSGTAINPATKTLTISAPVTLNSTLQNNGTLSVSDNVAGSGTIANNGTLNAVGSITIGPAVNNSGQVSTSSVLALTGGGTHSGSFTVTSPGNLSFSSGTHSVTGGGSINGTGTLSFSGATATVSVPVNVGTMNVTGGTATLNANGSADAFTMTGGTLGGSGTLTLTNGGTWSGGTMSGSGKTTNPATKSLGISAPVTLTGRTLQNDGTLNVSGATVAGSGTIDNNGTINDAAGATISAPMNNSGQVTTTALLSLAGNGSHNGTFTATGAGSVIDFSGGAQTISGTLAGTGTFRFSGAAATVNGAWSGMTIDVAGGSVALNTSGTIPALTLSGGTLAGSGNLTVAGPSTWSGGTIGGGGALTFDAGATVAMPGTSAATLSRPLLNNGTIHFAAASSALVIDNVPVTNNGTLDIQSSQSILVTAGTPPFVNNGTLTKSGGAGVMQFAAPLSNTGLVQAGAGTLHFSGTYDQSAGTTDVLSGATLQTATLSLAGGSLIGNGTVAGTVDSHALVAPGASPGTLTITGDYVQASDGTLDIQIGGTTPGTQYDRLVVSGNVTLAGILNVSIINGFVPAAGNAFQILSFATRLNSTTFEFPRGLDRGAGTALAMTYSSIDLQLITNTVQADLAASVSAPPSVASGSAFAYTVNVFNGGGSNATGVTFNATLPPNVTFTGASSDICIGAPNLVCTVGNLADQSTAVVVLGVTAHGPGAAPISVSATGNDFDPDTTNNAASASPSITSAADLRIAVTGAQSTVAGSRTIYTIAVTNSGPDLADNVAVSVAASPGMTFGANGGACIGSFPCAIGALSSGQSATIHSAWDLSPAATGSVQLTVNAASTTADPNSANNSASATTLIGTCPTIVITAPGELPSGASAEATATTLAGATYHWSISNGTIDSGDGTDRITFTTGVAGNATLTVNVTGGDCTLSATVLMTVKARRTCQGTATPTEPADDSTVDAVVAFRWNGVEGASGYRLWLQQGDAPPLNLGRTLGTSLTKIIPPGTHRWYVETLFDGCPSHQSEHLALTILPGQDCATHGAPQLSAPANDTPVGSANVAFSWDAVAKAFEYELWLAPAGGVPTLIRTTADTSSTAEVPPGRLEWYVRAVFGGCAATESVHRTLTYTPPPQCTSQRPLLIQPAEGERLTSPASFEWREVPGATSYELYIDGVRAATTTSPRASGIPVPQDERRWRVRALLAEGCSALDSAESRLVVVAPPPSCSPLDPPVVTAPAQISSGISGRIQWTFVAGATAYVVQISSDPQFTPASTSSSTVTARQLPFTFTNENSVPVSRYVRVYAVDTKCVVPGNGPFSPVAVLSIVPRTGNDGVVSMTDPVDVPYTLSIGAELAGLSFTATPTTPWITVTPASGIVPPGGQTLRAVAHTAGLPPGASTGSVIITTNGTPGTPAALGVLPTVTITISNISGVTTKPKNTPPPDSLTIPAVANVKNFIVRYQSDLSLTNTSAQVIKYQINFVPSGLPGISEGQTTDTPIEPGATLALNDIVKTWFGGLTSSGTLEIRPVTESDTSTSSAPAGGLAQRISFAASRTFTVTPDGGTYGQYVPAVPYTDFVGKGGVISLQQIAQSEKFRTNLGLVEGSGEPVSVAVRVFDATGIKRGDFNVDLTGGQHTQLNAVLKDHGIALDDGRIEVEVTEGEGKVTAYASVIETGITDPLFVPPVNIGNAGHSKWVVPGVAGRTGASSNWQTDVRIFNADKETADLTLEFYSGKGGAVTSQTMKLAAGEVRQLDRILSSFFGIAQDDGALHVSSAAPARLVITARTYNETAQGAYGQFIPAVTPEEAVAIDSRPLQILQVEESTQYRSNIGFAEVSGKAVTLEVSVIRPNHNDPVLLEVKLGPNEFRQIDSLLSTLGLDETYNARISVRAVGGEGRATAYLSLIDMKSGDPTYVPGQ
jgi:uncharacterized repeat protein (TIGR01451 family)